MLSSRPLRISRFVMQVALIRLCGWYKLPVHYFLCLPLSFLYANSPWTRIGRLHFWNFPGLRCQICSYYHNNIHPEQNLLQSLLLILCILQDLFVVCLLKSEVLLGYWIESSICFGSFNLLHESLINIWTFSHYCPLSISYTFSEPCYMQLKKFPIDIVHLISLHFQKRLCLLPHTHHIFISTRDIRHRVLNFKTDTFETNFQVCFKGNSSYLIHCISEHRYLYKLYLVLRLLLCYAAYLPT